VLLAPTLFIILTSWISAVYWTLSRQALSRRWDEKNRHYGTFGGLPTRILYVFVGLSPLILFITGFVMWWFRRKQKGKADRASVTP